MCLRRRLLDRPAPAGGSDQAKTGMGRRPIPAVFVRGNVSSLRSELSQQPALKMVR